MQIKRFLISSVLVLSVTFSAFASTITFGGGKTSISNSNGKKTIVLTENAHAETESIKLQSDIITLRGEDYCYLDCEGNVVITEEEKQMTLKCPSLFYDRVKDSLMADGWIEINDIKNEAQLSGAWLEYKRDTSVLKLQIQASLKKSTESGLLSCNADSIEYNQETQILILKGNAKATWGDDHYSASMIVVNIETEDVDLYGSISGEVNG